MEDLAQEVIEAEPETMYSALKKFAKSNNGCFAFESGQFIIYFNSGVSLKAIREPLKEAIPERYRNHVDIYCGGGKLCSHFFLGLVTPEQPLNYSILCLAVRPKQTQAPLQ